MVKEEYHDPDYSGTSLNIEKDNLSLAEEDRVEKIKDIIRREFAKELEVRENEILEIDQRSTTARRLLYHLRYSLVNSYYKDQKLHLTNAQLNDEVMLQSEPRARAQVNTIIQDSKNRIHPSLRKLLGKKSVDLTEIFKSRTPRNTTRKDYSAMVQRRNYTVPADKTTSLRPEQDANAVKRGHETEDPSTSRPKKVPRHIEPRVENVLTLDQITRNKMKHRYRIVIGNTSKYAPAASGADRSTHKWLVYVRGLARAPDGSRAISSVCATLHHSYAPHHVVHLRKPPFHISRRGWGEFPVQLELHFLHPDMNRPVIMEHTIKLDRNYTGLQTLGAETIIDVWLYSTPEMIQYALKDEISTSVEMIKSQEMADEIKKDKLVNNENSDLKIVHKEESTKIENVESIDWTEFLGTTDTELDVDKMIIKTEEKELTYPENDSESLIESNTISKDIDNIQTDFNSDLNTYINVDVQKYELVTPDESGNEENSIVMEDCDNILPNEIHNQQASSLKRIMKYIDPSTGKIYYLEMDRKLDLATVQEIVINSEGRVQTAKVSPIKSNGLNSFRKNNSEVSVLKENVIKQEAKLKVNDDRNRRNMYAHISNDHCYLGPLWAKSVSFSNSTLINDKENQVLRENEKLKKENPLYTNICEVLKRFTCVRVAVNYLLKKIPLICDKAQNVDYLKHFPFTVECDEIYWKMDFAKRRNIEWSRAKLINTLLTQYLRTKDGIWRTKQILIYSRLHGFYPVRKEALHKETMLEELDEPTNEWSSWKDLYNVTKHECNIKEYFPSPLSINSLTIFNSEEMLNSSMIESLYSSDSDEEIDVVQSEYKVTVKKEVLPHTSSGQLTLLPVENLEDRLRFMFVESKCADIGIELRNEDIGYGYSYSAVHAVLTSAMRSFAEELLRAALAVHLSEDKPAGSLGPIWTGSSTSKIPVRLQDVYRACLAAPTSSALAATAPSTSAPTTSAPPTNGPTTSTSLSNGSTIIPSSYGTPFRSGSAIYPPSNSSPSTSPPAKRSRVSILSRRGFGKIAPRTVAL